MLRRIGYRHTLPPLQVVLYALLWFNGHVEMLTRGPCTFYWSSLEPVVFAQELESVEFPPPCREPVAERATLALDFPAVLAGAALGDVLGAVLHHQSDVWIFIVSAPMVALLWYWIGLWVDRRLGYVGGPQRRGRLFHVLARVAYGASVLMAALGVAVLLHSVSSHLNRARDLLVGGTVTGWGVFLAVVSGLNLRRLRSPLAATSDADSPHP